MKIPILVSSTILFFILNACQGRNMPSHPSLLSPHKDNNLSKPIPLLISKDTNASQKSVHKSISPKPKIYIKKTKASQPIKIAIKKPTLSKQLIAKKDRVLKKPSTHTMAKLPPLPKIPSIHKVVAVKPSQPVVTHTLPKVKLPIPPVLDSKKRTETVANKIIHTNVSQPRESFSGGGIADGLDMATIRIGKSSDYTSIIFDSYKYEGKDVLPSKKSPVSGAYLFTYEPTKKRIVGIIDGYRAFTALLSDQKALFSDNNVVKNIFVLKRMGSDGIKFVIQLRKNVRANIFDVKNPGRIIVNLFPQ